MKSWLIFMDFSWYQGHLWSAGFDEDGYGQLHHPTDPAILSATVSGVWTQEVPRLPQVTARSGPNGLNLYRSSSVNLDKLIVNPIEGIFLLFTVFFLNHWANSWNLWPYVHSFGSHILIYLLFSLCRIINYIKWTN